MHGKVCTVKFSLDEIMRMPCDGKTEFDERKIRNEVLSSNMEIEKWFGMMSERSRKVKKTTKKTTRGATRERPSGSL